MTASKSGEIAKPESLGRVSFLDGQGELPMLEVSTPWSTAEIYLHGAHVTHFKKKDEPPLLFVSQCSRFAEGQPIRGGIPVIFPWFGSREGLGQHGFARTKAWEVREFARRRTAASVCAFGCRRARRPQASHLSRRITSSP